MSIPPRKPILFDRPAIYQILVQGKIDPNWSDRLEGLSISQAETEAGSTTTILQGQLSDQAALAGVLNALYELHLTVLAVQRQESGSEIEGGCE
jgi:hypothetical protein